jgi:hypothetical protein
VSTPVDPVRFSREAVESTARQALADAERIDWSAVSAVSLAVHVGALTEAVRELLEVLDCGEVQR